MPTTSDSRQRSRRPPPLPPPPMPPRTPPPAVPTTPARSGALLSPSPRLLLAEAPPPPSGLRVMGPPPPASCDMPAIAPGVRVIRPSPFPRRQSSRIIPSGSPLITTSTSEFSRTSPGMTLTWVPMTPVRVSGDAAFTRVAMYRSWARVGVPVVQRAASGRKAAIRASRSRTGSPRAGKSTPCTSWPSPARKAAAVARVTGGHWEAQTPASWVQRPSRVNPRPSGAGGLNKINFMTGNNPIPLLCLPLLRRGGIERNQNRPDFYKTFTGIRTCPVYLVRYRYLTIVHT